MRTIIFLAVAVISGQDASVQSVAANVRMAVEDYLWATSPNRIELVSLGIPVKTESCRIFDRGKGVWVSAFSDGIALHVRYRTRDRFGATVMHSKVAFLDDKGKVLDAYDTGSVRSNDPRLMK